MRILAIDPADKQIAYCRWDTERRLFIRTPRCEGKDIIPVDEFLQKLDFLSWDCDLVAIEMIQSYGMGVGKTTFETCLVVGRIIQALAYSNAAYKLFGRPSVKGQIGGKTDAEISASLKMRYCSHGCKGAHKKGCFMHGVKKDINAAFALAVALEENPNLKEW